jgi:hypothetical protein
MGFDSPIDSKAQDCLDRWSFAQQAARIAMEAPREWSVRIGIYGGWGAGKTSVLNLVRQIAFDEGHVVVWFNPWGCSGSIDLWLSFVSSFSTGLSKHDDPRVKKIGKSLRAKKLYAATVGWLDDNAAVIDASASAGASAFGLPILSAVAPVAGKTALFPLKKFSDKRISTLMEVASFLPQKRVVVLIDDLDRAHPALLPQLLYALKEVLDLPGLSFVLAVDPERIGQVLESINPGWRDGTEYLKKIVDFPRHIPPPTLNQLRRLTMADISRYCPFVPQEAVTAVVDLFPANPRFVRQYVRDLWCLEPLARRHQDGELNWVAVSISQLIWQRWPALWERLFPNKNDSVATIEKHFQQEEFDSIVEDDEQKRGTLVDDLVDRHGLDDVDDRSMARTAARRLIGLFPFSGSAHSLYYSLAIHRSPPALTWKEFDEFLVAWRSASKSIDSAVAWIVGHADQIASSPEQVYRELVDATIDQRLELLQRASDSATHTELTSNVGKASALLELLFMLTVPIPSTGDERFSLTVSDALRCINMVKKWAHFKNTAEYRELRISETDFLCSLAQEAEVDVSELLGELEPWDESSFIGESEAAFAPLATKIVGILGERVAASIAEDLESGVDVLHKESIEKDVDLSLLARRYVFLSPSGAFWRPESGHIKQLTSLCDRARQEPSLASLLLKVITLMAYRQVPVKVVGRENWGKLAAWC